MIDLSQPHSPTLAEMLILLSWWTITQRGAVLACDGMWDQTEWWEIPASEWWETYG